MKNQTFRIVLGVAGLLVMALVALIGGGGVQFLAAETAVPEAAPLPSEYEVVQASDQIQNYAESIDQNYWTAERMAQAVPYPIPELEGIPDMSQMSQPEVLTGDPFIVAGVWPGQAEAATGMQLMRNLDVYASPDLKGYSYPPPYTRYRNIQTYLRYPYITVGKIFFNQNGSSYVCSGALIDENTVWTAGHCVSDGNGNWSTNLMFVPAYKNGSAPVGFGTATNLIALSAWHNSSDFARDYGTAILDTNLGNTTGWLGFAANTGREQHWFQIGYPAASPFDGSKQQICTSSFAVMDSSLSPASNGTGCDMTGGSSGGPWIWRFGRNNGNYLNGNVSYGYTGFGEQMFSPYLDNAALNLYNASVD